MAQYTTTVFRLLKRLRWKAKDNPELNSAIDRVVWHSFPVVYQNYDRDVCQVRKEVSSLHARRKRVRRYIRNMAKRGRLYLVSLTFGDCYDTTTRTTRDKYAREWLNKHTADYFACLDIGKKNNREHYHAIVLLDYPLEQFRAKRKDYVRPVDPSHAWTHGFYSIKPIETDETDLNKTLGYAFKASTYAFKVSEEDEKVRPFHKRRTRSDEWETLSDFSDLPF